MARWCRSGLSVSGSFVCRCLINPTVLRFHIPLIEPDRRYSRIRLSEETSRFRPRKVGGSLRKPDQTKLLVQGVVGIRRGSRARHFVFGAQPLAQPPARVSFHRPVGFADRTEAKVVGPSDYQSVKPCYYRLYVPLQSDLVGSLG